jgi:catechol 2,3-dioxygenase
MIRPPRSRAAKKQGLFHTAFLLPSRTDLAQWLLHAAERRVPLHGASDHRVSEAIYLADPEGNGVEVYHDRPSETWTWRNGMIEMATLPLDLHDLAATVQTRDWSGLPEGSCIGHVHLQVGELEPAEDFYGGLLGLDAVSRIPGATFFSSGGYHHHLATNTWNSRGAPVRSEAATGLANVAFVTDAGVLEAVRSRLSPEQAAHEGSGHLSLRDPWGTSITL